jgi:cytochrome P450 family 135
VRTNAALPPGSRLPSAIQSVRLSRDPIGFFIGARRRYGDVFRASFLGFHKLVYVADPGLVKEVFAGDPARFHAGEANATVLEPALGPNSVLTLDEDEHLRQRKLLLPPFHGEAIRRYGEVIRRVAERDIATWPLGEPFALRPHMQAITLEVILRTVFGVTDPDRLERARRVVDEFAARSDLILLIPFLRRDLGRRSPWARFKRARAALDELVYEEIALRRAELHPESRDDVLSLLLRARHDDGSPMSDAELRDELVTVIGAGHETTATALAWAVERLVRTPRALARLRLSLAADEDEYLDATIKETLRVRPVLSDVARKLTAATRIGRYTIPAGWFVLPGILAIHYRDDLFSDPHEFRPERFLDGEGGGLSWIPFGGGVRRCIGAAFAQYEMRIVLRAIIEHADLRAADPKPERPVPRNITLAPARGASVVLERRPKVAASARARAGVAAGA